MDIDPSERICNLLPSRDTASDWRLQDALQSQTLRPAAAPLAAEPQASDEVSAKANVDLRQDWWTIGDQGRTGSCVGWAAADGLMRYHMHEAGKIRDDELLSVRYLWMASKETDPDSSRATTFIEEAGTYLKAAVDICRKWGVAPATLMPFQIDTLMYTGSESIFYATAARFRCSAYFNLGKDPAQWRTWLASEDGGPILAGLTVDATWQNATATNGVLDTFQRYTANGGHAVCIVGYTADGRFIVRNSWGTSWGDQGFAYASEGYISGAFFPESYGITV